MVTDLGGPIGEFVTEYGVAAIFVFLVLDSAMLMPLLPGELLVVILTQRFVSDSASLWFMVLVATVAATLGSLILYGIARGGGRKFFEKYPRLFFMSPSTRDKMERLFQRPSGQALVLILRLFPFLRLLVNIPAGLARMPVKRFLVLSFIGNLLFMGGFMYITYESGREGSPVAAKLQAWQADFGDPFVAFFQTNWIIAVLALVLFGIVASVRAATKASRRPEDGYSGSLIGWLVNLALFWGSLAILVGLWADPPLVYDTIEITGYDVTTMDLDVPFQPLSVLAGLGVMGLLIALLVSDMGKSAKRGAKRVRRERKRGEAAERARVKAQREAEEALPPPVEPETPESKPAELKPDAGPPSE